MKKEKVGGIYKITCLINGKFYIGSTINFNFRKTDHFHRLRKGFHINTHLQKSFKKHGENNFIFEKIEFVEDFSGDKKIHRQVLLEREQFYLDLLKPWSREVGYNYLSTAGSPLGTTQSDEAKNKKSIALTGIKRSQETKDKISKSKTGKKPFITNESRLRKKEKMSGENHYGAKLTWEKVNFMREKFKNEVISSAQLAKEVEMDLSTISDIINNKQWEDKTYEPPSTEFRLARANQIRKNSDGKPKLSWGIVREMRECFLKTKPPLRFLSDKFQISVSLVSKIIRNERWKIENDPLFKSEA